jgi:hypothetical protein
MTSLLRAMGLTCVLIESFNYLSATKCISMATVILVVVLKGLKSIRVYDATESKVFSYVYLRGTGNSLR